MGWLQMLKRFNKHSNACLIIYLNNFINFIKDIITGIPQLTSIISVWACLLHDVDGGAMVRISTKAFGNCPISGLTSLWQAKKWFNQNNKFFTMHNNTYTIKK